MMRGHTILKFVDAKQAKDTHLYKNTKEERYKTTAAMWYNEVCRDTQLTPNYITIKVNGKNLHPYTIIIPTKCTRFLLLKAQDITICTFLSRIFASTCFNPRGSSSGGSMSVPG
jgi:hypothetical protein